MIRSHLADYHCDVPASIQEALQLRADHAGIIPIAGGTEVMVWLNDAKAPAGRYMSLHRLAPAWRHLTPTGDGGLTIGALATYTDVRHHPHVAANYPLLVESARITGALQIQNRGTLAGNVANGSPAADTMPPLLVYDAELELISLKGSRRVPLDGFYTGYRRNLMRPDELIAAIHLPPTRFQDARTYYHKAGTREAQAISKVVFAGARSADGRTVRLAWGSVGPTTLRTHQTENAVASGANWQEAWQVLQTEITPIDDIRSTGAYRLKLARNILKAFLLG
jgi:CO/xanthine dehydrogenase FAD-binding subunit